MNRFYIGIGYIGYNRLCHSLSHIILRMFTLYFIPFLSLAVGIARFSYALMILRLLFTLLNGISLQAMFLQMSYRFSLDW